MQTEFMLLALYNSALIPVEEFCVRDMGISFTTAKNQISAKIFPVPVFKVGKKLVMHAGDAAAWIDKEREGAMKSAA